MIVVCSVIGISNSNYEKSYANKCVRIIVFERRKRKKVETEKYF